MTESSMLGMCVCHIITWDRKTNGWMGTEGGRYEIPGREWHKSRRSGMRCTLRRIDHRHHTECKSRLGYLQNEPARLQLLQQMCGNQFGIVYQKIQPFFQIKGSFIIIYIFPYEQISHKFRPPPRPFFMTETYIFLRSCQYVVGMIKLLKHTK